jgi:hypothetical protein
VSNTISTSGIAPGFIIEADQLLRVIYALNGVSGSDIIISGSLGVTGSAEFSSSVNFFAGATGSLFGTSSWAVTASYALNAESASYFSGSVSNANFAVSASYALTASYFTGSVSNADFAVSASYALTASYVNLFPYTGSAIFSGSILTTGSVNITGSLFVNGVPIGAGFNVIADPGPGRVILSDGTPTAATASVNLIYTGSNFFVTGSTVFTAVPGETSIVTIKSGSSVFLTVDTESFFDIYSSLFNIKNPTTQQPVFTVSESVVSFATQSLDPTGVAPNGGIYFTSTSFYVGLD